MSTYTYIVYIYTLYTISQWAVADIVFLKGGVGL